MSLSDKSSWLMDAYEKHYYKKDVKKAIQELKAELSRPIYGFTPCSCYYGEDSECKGINHKIDKIFGEELSK